MSCLESRLCLSIPITLLKETFVELQVSKDEGTVFLYSWWHIFSPQVKVQNKALIKKKKSDIHYILLFFEREFPV